MQALFLNDPTQFNTTREDCIWKRGNERDQCPDEDITMILYTAKKTKVKVRLFIYLLNAYNSVEEKKINKNNYDTRELYNTNRTRSENVLTIILFVI